MNTENTPEKGPGSSLVGMAALVGALGIIVAAQLSAGELLSRPRAGLSRDRALDELLLAVIDGDSKQARQVLARGVEVNRLNDAGVSVLHRAVAGRRTDSGLLVSLLIENGADVNRPDRFGSTPLAYAVTLQNHDAEKVLIDSGALSLSGADQALCRQH
ncbi:MAG: ankyrin repeat domain-containing protein [Tepidisphaeraceae bacterium]